MPAEARGRAGVGDGFEVGDKAEESAGEAADVPVAPLAVDLSATWLAFGAVEDPPPAMAIAALTPSTATAAEAMTSLLDGRRDRPTLGRRRDGFSHAWPARYTPATGTGTNAIPASKLSAGTNPR
ncbi:hypothetical protein ABH935_009446 [Catenulispora sp. GAS73]|uniref:hypothetical protein n=1 Tax=Catenulispora sp. GAS73 TaxID=3156269 RepID=UPI003515B09B